MLTVFAAGAVENLVVNPDFESFDSKGRPVGWNSLPSNFRVERSAGENGTCGLVYENADPSRYQLPGQRVKMEKGVEYRFSARVRIEDLERNGHSGGANVCVEFFDASGKWVGGAYAHAVRDTKGGWTTVECLSAKLSDKAVVALITPYVARGCTGKVFFDSIRLEKVDHAPVSGLWCSAYQSLAAEGEVEFVAGLELGSAGLKVGECRAVFEYVRADGRKTETEASTFTGDEARLMLKVADLKSGESTVGFSLRSRLTDKEIVESRFATTFTRVAKLPERKVRFDARRRLIVDGKPFFPLGVYACERLTDEDLRRFGGSAVNCVMNYKAPTKADMDAYAAHGLRFFYNLKDAYVGRWFKTEASAERFVRQKVVEVKDHPALLAWYVNDELGIDHVPQLRARYELLRVLDPDHPSWAVVYQIGMIRYYMGTCDVLGTDPYPISAPDATIANASSFAERTNAGLFGIRPVWQVPQAFDWGAYWKGKDDQTRPPTREEMANMGWQSIACGANGLVYYSYSDMKRMDHKTPLEKSWGDLASVLEEIGRFAPVLLLGDEPPPVTCSNEVVRVRSWRDGDKVYVLAVNTTSERQVVSVGVSGGCKAATAELGSSPTVGPDGTVSSELEPMAAAMWRLDR